MPDQRNSLPDQIQDFKKASKEIVDLLEATNVLDSNRISHVRNCLEETLTDLEDAQEMRAINSAQ